MADHVTKMPPRTMSVVNGHVMIDYTHKSDARPGEYSHGVAIFAAPAGEAHSHAVWDVIYNDETDSFVCQMGDYCFSFDQAINAYRNRGGNVA